MGSFNRDDRPQGGFHRGGKSSFGGRSSFGHGAPRSDSFDRNIDRGNRPLFDATCSNCGKECKVPFRPTNGKPVYCSDCFEKMGNRGDSRRSERTDFRPQNSGFDPNKQLLDSINAKLDKILNLMQPKVAVPVFPTPVIKAEIKEEVKPASVVDSGEAKVEKAPKAKKTVKKVASSKK